MSEIDPPALPSVLKDLCCFDKCVYGSHACAALSGCSIVTALRRCLALQQHIKFQKLHTFESRIHPCACSFKNLCVHSGHCSIDAALRTHVVHTIHILACWKFLSRKRFRTRACTYLPQPPLQMQSDILAHLCLVSCSCPRLCQDGTLARDQ